MIMALEFWKHPPTDRSIEYFYYDRGLAEFRNENYKLALESLIQADEKLTQSITKAPEERGRRGWDNARTACQFVMAICERRLGNNERARGAMNRAEELLRTSVPAQGSGDQRIGFDWLMVHIIAREAKDAIPTNTPAKMPTTLPSTTRPASQAVPAS